MHNVHLQGGRGRGLSFNVGAMLTKAGRSLMIVVEMVMKIARTIFSLAWLRNPPHRREPDIHNRPYLPHTLPIGEPPGLRYFPRQVPFDQDFDNWVMGIMQPYLSIRGNSQPPRQVEEQLRGILLQEQSPISAATRLSLQLFLNNLTSSRVLNNLNGFRGRTGGERAEAVEGEPAFIDNRRLEEGVDFIKNHLLKRVNSETKEAFIDMQAEAIPFFMFLALYSFTVEPLRTKPLPSFLTRKTQKKINELRKQPPLTDLLANLSGDLLAEISADLPADVLAEISADLSAAPLLIFQPILTDFNAFNNVSDTLNRIPVFKELREYTNGIIQGDDINFFMKCLNEIPSSPA